MPAVSFLTLTLNAILTKRLDCANSIEASKTKFKTESTLITFCIRFLKSAAIKQTIHSVDLCIREILIIPIDISIAIKKPKTILALEFKLGIIITLEIIPFLPQTWQEQTDSFVSQ